MVILNRIELKKLYKHPFIFSMIIGFFLLLINQLAVYFPYITGETAPIVWATSLKKKYFNHANGSTDYIEKLKEDFLLIDISNDQQLNCDPGRIDSVGMIVDNDSTAIPCKASPDLIKTAELLSWLSEDSNRSKYGYVFCDLIFEELPDNEETKPLLSSLNNLQFTRNGERSKLIMANYYDPVSHQYFKSEVSGYFKYDNKSVANSLLSNEVFSHYRLSYKRASVLTSPLKMMERFNKVEILPGILGTYRNQSILEESYWAYNEFIPEMLIGNADIDKLITPGNFSNLNTAPNSTINKMDIWQALATSEGHKNFYLEQALKSRKKNIIIGSFNHRHTDMHKTIYGDMDGAIILLNIYYNLLNKENKVDVFHLIFLFIGFSSIGFTILKASSNPYKGNAFLLKFFIELFLEKLHYLILLFILLFSAIVFNTISHVFVMLGIVAVLAKFLKVYKKHYKIES